MTPSSKDVVTVHMEQEDRLLRPPASHRGGSAVTILSILVVALATSTAVLAASLASVSSSAGVPGEAAFSASLGVEPSALVYLPELSTPNMRRHDLSYNNTTREGLTIAAGRNAVLAANGSVAFFLYTEVLADVPEAAYAAVSGRIGTYSLRMRVRDPKTGASASLTPTSISMKQAMAWATATGEEMPAPSPTLFLFHYSAGEGMPVVSDLVGTQGWDSHFVGAPTFYHGHGAQAWEAIVKPFLVAYEAAYSRDIAANATGTRRSLSARSQTLDDDEDARRRMQSYGGDNYGGESFGSEVGGSVGGDVGGNVGGDIGGDVGEAVGEAAGDAVAGPIGGAVGGYIGKEASPRLPPAPRLPPPASRPRLPPSTPALRPPLAPSQLRCIVPIHVPRLPLLPRTGRHAPGATPLAVTCLNPSGSASAHRWARTSVTRWALPSALASARRLATTWRARSEGGLSWGGPDLPPRG